MPFKYCYLYRTEDPTTGEYYIGRHRTNDLEDQYQGSGLWVKKAKKQGKILVTTILGFMDESLLKEAERLLIGDLWMEDPLCKNVVPGGGGGSGSHPHTQESRGKISKTRKRKKLRPVNYNKCTTWINNGERQKRIFSADLERYLETGWVVGMLTANLPNHKNAKWINNGTSQIRVLDWKNYLTNGWKEGRLEVSYTKVKCPHCGVVGGTNVIKRWHFDNCKKKL